MPRRVQASQSSQRSQGSSQKSPASQGSQGSQAQRVPAVVDEKIINDLIRFLLGADSHKDPIKLSDINKHVMNGGRFSTAILEAANEKLRETFGLELVENLDCFKSHRAYFLVNVIDKRGDILDIEDLEAARYGLLFVILALILLTNDFITEKDLKAMLEKIGIDLDGTKEHPVFGETKKIIPSFEKQRYLTATKVGKNATMEQIHYSWGPRAKSEITCVSTLIEKAAEIYGCEPAAWIDYYKQRLKAQKKQRKQQESQQ